MMKRKHIDDRSCNDCRKYSCNYIITNGKKGYNCSCGCHEELKKEKKEGGNE